MLDFLFSKKEENTEDKINRFFDNLKKVAKFDELAEDRKEFLRDIVEKYGYLPYPHIKALEELSEAEVLYALQVKWENNNIYKDGVFSFENDKISVVARAGFKNSDWIKKEGHDIKLVNLAGLGNGNETDETGKIFDWLRQLLILPTGNKKRGILDTTIYLIPFHPREFGCAYLPTSTGVSDLLRDDRFSESVQEQVQNFITLAQLAGHPVIYDILPQTGRFAKVVLANPYIARWYDINALNDSLMYEIDKVAEKLAKTHDLEDITVVKEIVKQSLNGSTGDLTEFYQNLYDEFDKELLEAKKQLSNKMLTRSCQATIQKRVKEVVAKCLGEKTSKKLAEEDIKEQGMIIQTLISKGLWPAPGGAWCSAGVPVYDRMSEDGGYPMFTHYDYKGDDVTNFANLDCQTPYYFVFLEEGKYNYPVLDFFIAHMKKLQKTYNFDGFRVDHIDHVVDKVSQKDGAPISYRAPSLVLSKLNSSMRFDIPYFVTLAEYMLWDKFYKEYHEDMKFDMLWGNDVISQYEKNPAQIIEDNEFLANYNTENFKIGNLSILKTYNNQDGEFRAIDQYPGQLGEEGAMFKWFKYKFLPGGKNSQRPMMYIDGDESFTQTGIENVIGNEVSMVREKEYNFFKHFDAIDRFVKSQEIITEGEARMLDFDKDGFAVWIISKEPLKNSYLVVANYNNPTERVMVEAENGVSQPQLKEGYEVTDKFITLPCDLEAVAEYKFDGEDIAKIEFSKPENSFRFDRLEPAEYKVFLLRQV